MDLDAKAWQAFSVSAKCGSISKAAKEMRCSHSTLSRQIASLEDDLGYELFSRNGTGKKLVLTREGQLLTEKANIAIQTLTELNHQAMHFFDSNTPKSITFAIPDVVPTSVEVQLATALWQKWPHLEVSFLKPSFFESLVLCHNQKVDFAIILQEPKRVAPLKTEVIGRTAFSILVSPSHPLASVVSVNIASLTPYRLFFPIAGKGNLSYLEEDLFSINTCFIQQCSQGLELASKGLGIAYAPGHLAQPYIERGELITLPIFSSPLSLDVSLELAYLAEYPYQATANFVLEQLILAMKASST